MKKLISILLTAVLLLTITACTENALGGKPSNPQNPNPGNGQQSGDPGTGDPETNPEGFGLTFSEVKLVPGAAFDASKLPEADSVSQVPSCAFDGTDNAYNYGAFELTAYNEGNGEIIYSIYLLDANTATDEGLYLGDTLSRAEELYGNTYEKVGTQVTYTKGNTLLILILQEDSIVSIEYRMAQS